MQPFLLWMYGSWLLFLKQASYFSFVSVHLVISWLASYFLTHKLYISLLCHSKYSFYAETLSLTLICIKLLILEFSSTKYVTGFAKRGLPHASKYMSLKTCILVLKQNTSLKLSPLIFLTHVSTLCSANFKFIAFIHVHLKLWIVEFGKFDVCWRPLFANPVTYYEHLNPSMSFKVTTCIHPWYVTGFWKINHFVMREINRTQHFASLPKQYSCSY